jgi:hypothetical protein
MINFREFISEGGYNVPVVSLDKEKVNLSNESTRNEINRNLAAVLSSGSTNPYGSWIRVSKVLSMYGVNLPRVIFQDAEEGEEVVEIHQFGEKWGASLDGTVTQPNDVGYPDYYLYFNYGIGENGFYESFATVTDEEGLNDLIGDDVDEADEILPDELTPEDQLEVTPQ